MEVLKAVRWWWAAAFALMLAATPNALYSQQKAEQSKKPNIVVIWGDDIGYWNLGIYTHGMMGSHTQHRQHWP